MAAAVAPSSVGATLSKAIIPLIPKVKKEDREKVTITNYVNAGTQANPRYEKRKADIVLSSTGDHETLLRTIMEFMDHRTKLGLTTGTDCYEKFRECLGDNVRDTWDTVRSNFANTVPGFLLAIDSFILRYFRPTSMADQGVYLDTVKKPFRLTCLELGQRLSFINKIFE